MSPDLPHPLRDAPSGYAENGRGLAILEHIADRWGGCATGDGPFGPGGRTTWFELAIAAAPPRSPRRLPRHWPRERREAGLR